MRIASQPVVILYKNNLKQTLAQAPLAAIPGDTVVFSASKKVLPVFWHAKFRTLPIFQHIKLKTAVKLYNASSRYKPSNNDYGGKVFKTFVLSKKTGQPVEILVKPIKIENSYEEYYLLDPNKKIPLQETIVLPNLVDLGGTINIPYEDTMGMSIAGIRHFSYGEFGKEIISGEMSSYEKGEYSGLGFIEHQLTIERMLMKNCSQVNIIALPSAYKFHKDCGFEVIRDSLFLDEAELNSKIGRYAKRLNLDEDIVKSMLVYEEITKGKYRLYKNLTFEKIINYLRNNNLPLTDEEFSVDMRLTRGALLEWKRIIARRPILMGNNLKKLFYMEK